MTGRETYRAALAARLPGGDECTLLVLRVGGRVLLLYHAAIRTGAELTPEQAVQLGAMLCAAGSDPQAR